MGTAHEESWHTATNPRHLLRLSRVRPNGRKYLLLACAAVRHLVPGPRTELGTRALDELERFAVAQPAKGVTTHLWREVVRRHIPEIPEWLPYDNQSFQTDRPWVAQFAGRLAALSQVHTADVNVIFDLVLNSGSPSIATATSAAYVEAHTLAAQLSLGTAHAPAGWFTRLLGRASARAPEMRARAERFREAIIERLPPEKRDRVREEWPSAAAGASPWQQGLTYLTTARVEQQFADVNARACDLVREVFGNPFQPPVVDPSWLAWNHGAARHIADQILATGNFGDLPILGDALEDAGCCDAELLRHCREERVHVPGCWALDAVLGRN